MLHDYKSYISTKFMNTLGNMSTHVNQTYLVKKKMNFDFHGTVIELLGEVLKPINEIKSKKIKSKIMMYCNKQELSTMS